MSVASAAPAPDALEPPPIRRRFRLPAGLLAILGAVLIIGVLIRPMLWDRNFVGYDWYYHLWYIWHQEGSLRANGVPSLFAHNTVGVFDPHFAFYGGTLYVLAGLLALGVGHEAAFVLTWAMAFAVAYGGWYWLARMAGLGRWAAHAPGVLFITSSWYLSAIYAWGSWPQTIALSSLVLLLASGLSVLRADRLRPGPAVALAAATILYTGSHNLTLAWATTVSLLVGIVLLVVVPPARSLLTRRGLRRVVVVVVPAILVNGWFLLPDLVYQSHTTIANNTAVAASLVHTSMPIVGSEYLFSLARENPIPSFPHLAVQLPLLASVWVVLGLVAFRPRRRSPWLWTAVVLLVAMIGSWVLFTHESFILGLPRPYSLIQAPYRIEAYTQLTLSGAVIAGLVLARRAGPWRRRWAWLLVPVLVMSVVQARRQVDEPLPEPFQAPAWSTAAPYHVDADPLGAGDYVDARLRLSEEPPLRTVLFSTDAERGDRAEATVDAQPGELLRSNVKAASSLVRITGARFVARDSAGNGILQLDEDVTPGAARVRVEAANPWPVVLGKCLSVLGFLGLGALGIGIGRVARRGSRSAIHVHPVP
ncbi:MAG: hypothetical protein JWM93_198 [Frankiales bacterium]|nr:hypothetical protein [Frankiales bacterium]